MKHRTVIRSRRAAAFTLLEMVIVLGIIAVLLGSSISLISHITDGAKLQRVTSDFRSIGASVRTYQMNAGTFPSTAQGLQALITRPTSAPLPAKWTQVLDKLPPDPWGNSYGYKFPGTKKPGEFELISRGKDGQEGTDDDLNSQDE
ncbi:type II secretion system major pseudopilin GspG [Haloferula sp. BvORR071]|uniref:type II secretion system major pseudopilin GspG n=1 Tax=Haloferula sp. BvORR071 TaxID=1396141 RepID=UPI00054D6754|nr:type II secretion system major pseudopilin GspG [Haloferula sp. BvORR071]